MKRLSSIALSIILIFMMLPIPIFAQDLAAPIWDLDTLLSLGAKQPDYNAASDRYEISTPEQLLYLSGYWKNGDLNGDGKADAPCDGYYVLTDDIDMGPLLQKIGTGYMPPIAASDDESVAGGEKCAFFGTFDGQGHIISNLKIVKLDSKYCGMFGNIGYDYGEGFVKNLALVNARIEAKATCGLLAGAIYGTVENCFVQGSIDCLEKGAGGLAGKIKKNENGYLGTARNCFAYCDTVIHGESSENGAAGGITSASSNGGCIERCYAGGSIIVYGKNADCVGGVSGNLKSGKALDSNVSVMNLLSTVEGTNIGLLCGSYAGETGSHLANNYVWEGCRLEGNISSEHPGEAAFTYISSGEALSKSFFSEKAEWDMENDWIWNGSESSGYPTPAVFGDNLSGFSDMIISSLSSNAAVVNANEPLLAGAYTGDPCRLGFFTVNSKANKASIVYGTNKNAEKLKSKADMTIDGNDIYIDFPETKPGTYYYYLSVEINGKEIKLPSSGTFTFEIESAEKKLTPDCVTLCPGTTAESIGLNWTTAVGGLTSSVKYWKSADGQDKAAESKDVVIENVNIGDNMGSFVSYSADITGLAPDTEYQYQVFTNDGSKEYCSDVYTFTTLPKSGKIKFAVISDLQATGEDGYAPYKYTFKGFLVDQDVDFVINLGDLTEDNTFAQWKYYYSALGDVLAQNIHTYAPGNHENKGDALYSFFKGKTNLPGGIDDKYIGETISSFVVGDICFVGLNTEPYTGIDGADTQKDKMEFYKAQFEYAKKCFEESKCKWRIMYAHAGLIQEDPEATAFLEKMCNELDVDLYFNGHIHNYYRATADADGKHAEVGNATTFVTTSPMGEKFDSYEGEINDILDFQTGGKDDERQYVTIVELEENTLKLSAYQRKKEGDNYASVCQDYTEIDTISLEKKSGVSPVILVVGALVVVGAVCAVIAKSKKKAS